MKNFTPLKFQRDAVDELLEKFVALWKKEDRHLSLILKSPTGSGKTYTSGLFIRGLNHLPQWQEDKAFIWITFSDTIAMQSKGKIAEYFENNLENDLITISDLDSKKKLNKNDILFLNWQKVVARKASDRILRRPKDEKMKKEKGVYWEDFLENTHKDGREIILVIDEAHKSKSTELAQSEINKIDPKIIFHITATPNEKDELDARRVNGFVEVDREDVVDAGLIKESVIVQTEEDLKKHKGEDLDKILLDLGIEKRNELFKEYKLMGKKINPLMLIQLPNDDRKLIEEGIDETKESVVCRYLEELGVKDKDIAKWFDGREENMDGITDNESDIDFMIFKQAAGTGWDCPRASVLVMFREIQSNTFYVQTIGRILRMSEPQDKEDYKNKSKLRQGYLYTNYKRDVVEIPDQSKNNKPKNKFAYRRKSVKNISIESAYVSRVNYGDIPRSYEFQKSFMKSMNNYFGIIKDDIVGRAKNKIKKKGVDTEGKITKRIIVDAKYEDFDNLNYEFKKKGTDLDVEMSTNDIEKTFNYLCYKILREQTDKETKFTNVARSWSTLKSALRVWMNFVFGKESDYYYRVFIKDINQGSDSKFRVAIIKALKDFEPRAREIIKERKSREEKAESPTFTIKDEYSYPNDYILKQQKLCALNKFFVPKKYTGKKNEMLFKNYIDKKKDAIDWWFKNGDKGKDYFAVKYYNTKEEINSLFYPDWIIRFKNGKVGVFDTKLGQTATSQETKDKAKGLVGKIKELGKDYVGGIVVKRNNVWQYNDVKKYEFELSKAKKGDWKDFGELFE